MRAREQKGYVFRRGNSWFVRYWDRQVENGTVVRKQLCHKLAPVESEHRRLTTVLALAEDFLAPLNTTSTDPTRNLTVKDFATTVWLPSIEGRHAASTVHSTRYYWEHILAPHCGNALLRDFSTPLAQRLLGEIAVQNSAMKKTTLHKLKSILSAIFRLAIQQDSRAESDPGNVAATSARI